jgi:hypothetical protein
VVVVLELQLELAQQIEMVLLEVLAVVVDTIQELVLAVLVTLHPHPHRRATAVEAKQVRIKVVVVVAHLHRAETM